VQVGTANFYDPAATMKIVDGLAAYCLRNGLENIGALVGTVALD
jgi:dihydroorotate dehydrogenase (NAD+) catalytic subunit